MNDEIIPTEDEKTNLHPTYVPATEDSYIILRFVGNTAQLGHADLHKADPGQIFAAAEWLKHQAKKMLLAFEQQLMQQQMEAAKNSQNKIAVPPSNVFKPGDKIGAG